MRKNIKLLIMAIAALLSFTSAQADVEDWYTYWAVGVPLSVSYPSDLDSDMENMESEKGANRTKTSVDMLGFYWPLEDGKTMMGFVINGVADVIEDSSSDEMAVSRHLYSFSAMKFFGKEIGDGFFLRGDIGLSKANVTQDNDLIDEDVSSEWGVGLLAGIGYALPVSSESRWMFGLNYSYANADFSKSSECYSGSYGVLQLSVGGLW